jgi:hypothetical protein
MTIPTRAGDQRRDQCADVDPHVENREPGVAARIRRGIQVADDGGDVRLEQSGAHDNEHESRKERGLGEHRRQRDREMSQRDEHRAVVDRAPQTKPAVGDPPAGKRGEIDARRIDADDRGCRLPIEAEPAIEQRRRHEQHEQRTDPVIREPLPHLGEEQRAQAARVTEEPTVTRESFRVSAFGGMCH